METRTHARLKRLAVAYLVRQGCLAAATEVGCPIHRYRLDAAGYRDVRPREDSDGESNQQSLWSGKEHRPRRGLLPPRTIIIECKQSRADFLRDRRDLERLSALRDQIERRLTRLERTRIRFEEPHLRLSGESLFPGEEAWDFHRSSLPAYQHSLKRMRWIESKMYGETKFLTIARYRLADHLFLLAPRGMIRASEIPADWGLLECSTSAVKAEDLRIDEKHPLPISIRKQSPQLATSERRRRRMLRNIAVAATRVAVRTLAKEERKQSEQPSSDGDDSVDDTASREELHAIR